MYVRRWTEEENRLCQCPITHIYPQKSFLIMEIDTVLIVTQNSRNTTVTISPTSSWLPRPAASDWGRLRDTADNSRGRAKPELCGDWAHVSVTILGQMQVRPASCGWERGLLFPKQMKMSLSLTSRAMAESSLRYSQGSLGLPVWLKTEPPSRGGSARYLVHSCVPPTDSGGAVSRAPWLCKWAEQLNEPLACLHTNTEKTWASIKSGVLKWAAVCFPERHSSSRGVHTEISSTLCVLFNARQNVKPCVHLSYEGGRASACIFITLCQTQEATSHHH